MYDSLALVYIVTLSPMIGLLAWAHIESRIEAKKQKLDWRLEDAEL